MRPSCWNNLGKSVLSKFLYFFRRLILHKRIFVDHIKSVIFVTVWPFWDLGSEIEDSGDVINNSDIFWFKFLITSNEMHNFCVPVRVYQPKMSNSPHFGSPICSRSCKAFFRFLLFNKLARLLHVEKLIDK